MPRKKVIKVRHVECKAILPLSRDTGSTRFAVTPGGGGTNAMWASRFSIGWQSQREIQTELWVREQNMWMLFVLPVESIEYSCQFLVERIMYGGLGVGNLALYLAIGPRTGLNYAKPRLYPIEDIEKHRLISDSKLRRGWNMINDRGVAWSQLGPYTGILVGIIAPETATQKILHAARASHFHTCVRSRKWFQCPDPLIYKCCAHLMQLPLTMSSFDVDKGTDNLHLKSFRRNRMCM